MSTQPQHTPGPWKLKGKTISTYEKGEEAIANCHKIGLGDTHLVALANARLISAAPELLAALEIIAESDVQPGHVNFITKTRMAEIARTAIEKATT